MRGTTSGRLLIGLLTMAASTALIDVATGPAATAAALERYEIPLRTIELTVNDAIDDPIRDVFYASVATSDRVRGGQVVSVDPGTGAVVASFTLGPQPGTLAVAPDGSALYVGFEGVPRVAKFALPSMVEQWTYDLGRLPGVMEIPYIAADIAVSPTDTDTIAVALLDAYGRSSQGVVVIDGGVARPVVPHPGARTESLTFGSTGSVLFGSSVTVSGGATQFDVTPDGAIPTGRDLGLIGKVVFRSGVVFSGMGYVEREVPGAPLTPNPLVSRAPFASRDIALDAAAGRIFIGHLDFDPGPTYGRSILSEIDAATRLPVREWVWPEGTVTNGSTTLEYVGSGRLIRFASGVGTIELLDANPPRDFGSLGEFTAVTPTRILDTRSGLGRSGTSGPVGPGQVIDVVVTGVGGVPATGVDSVVVNVTAVDPTQIGFLTVYPTGIERPTISNLNMTPGVTVANLVTMPVGDGGRLSAYNAFGSVDLVFDVAGFYSAEDGPSGSRFHRTPPTRLLDTRSDGPSPRPLGPSAVRSLPIVGPLAQGADAVVLNVTVTAASAPSFLTVFPGDVDPPTVSNVNFYPSTTVASQVIVRVPAGGTVNLLNGLGDAHVIVDLVGYYDDLFLGNEGRFVSFEPFRALDTRVESPFDPPGDLWPGDIMYYGAADEVFDAYVTNVTVTGTREAGFVTAYPYRDRSSTPVPRTSTVNYGPGQTVPNHAIVGTLPYIGFYNDGGYTHLVVDVFGAFV